jgi:hypothetical protein
VTLTADEARDLLAALRFWAEAVAEGSEEPGWHTHITDPDGNELTIAIEPEESRPPAPRT